MVQVPYRTLYQIENVGNEAALRFEVNVARARKLYPLDETPVPLPDFDYLPTRVTGGRGTLDARDSPSATPAASRASSSATIRFRSRATRGTFTKKAPNSG